MRISDWSSDVCSSDLPFIEGRSSLARAADGVGKANPFVAIIVAMLEEMLGDLHLEPGTKFPGRQQYQCPHQHDENETDLHHTGVIPAERLRRHGDHDRSEEHTSELQSLMRISYAVLCLKKKKHTSKSHCITKQ